MQLHRSFFLGFLQKGFETFLKRCKRFNVGIGVPLNMRQRILFLALFFLLALAAGAQTNVYLVPVLHGLHKTNYFYPYDSVKAVVARTGADELMVTTMVADPEARLRTFELLTDAFAGGSGVDAPGRRGGASGG